jgi:hypothetical protein
MGPCARFRAWKDAHKGLCYAYLNDIELYHDTEIAQSGENGNPRQYPNKRRRSRGSRAPPSAGALPNATCTNAPACWISELGDWKATIAFGSATSVAHSVAVRLSLPLALVIWMSTRTFVFRPWCIGAKPITLPGIPFASLRIKRSAGHPVG